MQCVEELWQLLTFLAGQAWTACSWGRPPLLSLILCLKILVHHPQDQANMNVLGLSKILPFPTHCIVPCQDISPPVTMLISITGPSCSLSLLSVALSHISFPATILNRQKSNDGKVKTFVAKIDMCRRAMKVTVYTTLPWAIGPHVCHMFLVVCTSLFSWCQQTNTERSATQPTSPNWNTGNIDQVRFILSLPPDTPVPLCVHCYFFGCFCPGAVSSVCDADHVSIKVSPAFSFLSFFQSGRGREG